MKKHLFASAIFFVASRADCQEYYDSARSAADKAQISSSGASGAAQVSQLHNQAQTEIQTVLVKQGDNNLKMAERLLKQGDNNLTMAERIEGELKTLRKETADSRVQTLSSLESLETLRKETAVSKTQLLAVLESFRKETGTLVKYLGISLAVGLVAILAVLVAIYVQLRKTATRDSDDIRSSGQQSAPSSVKYIP